MKIFDATTVIAFLSEMRCPEGLVKLSNRYKILIPQGVADEITKSPGKEMLQRLDKQGVVNIKKVDPEKISLMSKEYPQLHRGECEAVLLAQSCKGIKKVCIVSDDSKARKIFSTLNFKWTEELLTVMKREGVFDIDTYNIKKLKLKNSPFYNRKGHDNTFGD